MRIRSRKLIFIIFLLLGWMISAALFVFAGYCIAGAIPTMKMEMNYLGRLLVVISSPFDGYFNEYTPIGMIAGFILCEIFYAIIIYRVFRNIDRKAVAGEDVASLEGELKKNTHPKTENFKKPKQKKSKRAFANEKKVSNKELTESEADVAFQEEIFLGLFNSGYSMQQITEMMELTKHIKNLDVSLLKRMFQPSMTPEEIRRNIEAFYG